MGNAHFAFGFCTGNCFSCRIANRTDGDDCHVFSVFQFPPFAYLYFFKRRFPVHQHPSSSGVTNHKRSFIGQLCGVHQIAQLMFIIRGCHRQIRDGAHICQIECTMMGRTVLAHNSCPVKAKNDIQLLNGDIVDNIVVCTLHERRIDVAERD